MSVSEEMSDDQPQAIPPCKHCQEPSIHTIPEPYCDYHWYYSFWLADYTKDLLEVVLASQPTEKEKAAALKLLEEKS